MQQRQYVCTTTVEMDSGEGCLWAAFGSRNLSRKREDFYRPAKAAKSRQAEPGRPLRWRPHGRVSVGQFQPERTGFRAPSVLSARVPVRTRAAGARRAGKLVRLGMLKANCPTRHDDAQHPPCSVRFKGDQQSRSEAEIAEAISDDCLWPLLTV